MCSPTLGSFSPSEKFFWQKEHQVQEIRTISLASQARWALRSTQIIWFKEDFPLSFRRKVILPETSPNNSWSFFHALKERFYQIKQQRDRHRGNKTWKGTFHFGRVPGRVWVSKRTPKSQRQESPSLTVWGVAEEPAGESPAATWLLSGAVNVLTLTQMPGREEEKTRLSPISITCFRMKKRRHSSCPESASRWGLLGTQGMLLQLCIILLTTSIIMYLHCTETSFESSLGVRSLWVAHFRYAN